METVKYEYHASYFQKSPDTEPIDAIAKNTTWYWQSSGFSVGSIVAKPTDLRGVNLVDWLQEIIAETVDAKKEEIVIIAISEIGAYVFEVED